MENARFEDVLKLGIFHCHVSLPKGISFFVGGQGKFVVFLGENVSLSFLFDTWVVAIVESALNCTGSWAQLACLSCDFHMTWVRCATRTSHIYFLQRTENSEQKSGKNNELDSFFRCFVTPWLFANPRNLLYRFSRPARSFREHYGFPATLALGDIPNGINWKCWKLKDLQKRFCSDVCHIHHGFVSRTCELF